ncbi:hypothetical protein F5Y10DRAFT_169876 [Nemania abortiva]|nr:hypothetical protein F5Y10DRAFT_169876 [Nemania abortiva]
MRKRLMELVRLSLHLRLTVTVQVTTAPGIAIGLAVPAMLASPLVHMADPFAGRPRRLAPVQWRILRGRVTVRRAKTYPEAYCGEIGQLRSRTF